MYCCNVTSKVAAKKEVSECSAPLHNQRTASTGARKGQPERQDFTKKVQNRKADCCTLLKRITRLKCVNSEFRSVDIHPEQGCLNWPYGTMSESP